MPKDMDAVYELAGLKLESQSPTQLELVEKLFIERIISSWPKNPDVFMFLRDCLIASLPKSVKDEAEIMNY
jgi:hypothetical protein